MSPVQLSDLLGEPRRRTRVALVVVFTGIFMTVLSGAIDEVFAVGLAGDVLLTLTGTAGLVLAGGAVWVLVRWVNERSVDLHLTLFTSNAVLWRFYPERHRLEFVAGDPTVVGVTERVVTDLASLSPLVDSRDLDTTLAAFQAAIARGESFVGSYRARTPSRGLREIAVRALPVGAGGRGRVVGVSWDETDAKAAAQRAERTGRLYAILGALGRVTRAAESLDRMYGQVCAAAVEAGGFALVWIGGEDPASGRIAPLARAGQATGYLDQVLQGDRPDDAAGRGPAGQAIRQGFPVWSNAIADDPMMTPWRDVAASFDLQSVAATPFRRPGGGRGVILLYVDQPGFFSVAERTLLSKLGDDLSAAAERLMVREEQRRERELLEALVASAPVPIMSLDMSGHVREIWNDAAQEVFGWSRDEVVGRPLPFVSAHAVEQTADLRRRVLGGEVVQDVPVQWRRKDGTALTMLLAAAPLHDVRGRVTGMLGIAMDQTERLAAEDRVRLSESRFRQLSEHAADIVYRYRIRPTPAVEYVNPAVEQALGYTPHELYSMTDATSSILHVEERDRFQRILQEPDSIDGRLVELRWRHRDGRTVWVEHRGSLVRDERGEVVALEGIARDITERKRFGEELARLSRVVEQTSEAVVVTELDGRIVYVNPAFESMSGWRRNEVIGETPRFLKSGEQSADFYAQMWARLTRGEEFSGRVTNRRKDGSPYLVDLVISPVRDPSGHVVNYVGLQRDVTRQRDLEEQLRQSQKMEALGQLTGGIAHDFNNLLTIILSNAGLLADAVSDRPDLQRDVQAIRTAAGRGARVVKQLMQFGRQERINRVPTDLGGLVRELVHTFQRVLPENIDTQLDIDADLPPALADPTSVEQILLNLATNARDAMPDGGELRVSIRRRPGAGDDPYPEWVVVSVRDTGLGMSREVVARIFEPFYTTKAAGKGTGLGLAMVYGIMEQHGGRVTVYSEPGLGTTIRLMFPTAHGATIEAQPGAAPEIPEGHGERVLLVEDEPGLRDVGERILERLGYLVVSAPDGASALQRLAEHQFDLMITDVVMPGMTGPQLAEAVRARGLTLPIVFATGYAAKDVLASIGENAHLVEKPWTLEDLATCIRDALNGG